MRGQLAMWKKQRRGGEWHEEEMQQEVALTCGAVVSATGQRAEMGRWWLFVRFGMTHAWSGCFAGWQKKKMVGGQAMIASRPSGRFVLRRGAESGRYGPCAGVSG